MRIKKILLSGFKSYKSQEKFDDFHPRVNVLVGRNGSGKSNLILAIRFLLSNEFQNIRSDDRRNLIHHGTGKESIIAGFVEIHFDNSEKRFPVDSAEVKLRRNIGVSKADYYLNGRHVTADEVMNLLESAGLSRSNPYYIVQQGKVQALVAMKPSARLELLHEVAGTRVYDERRQESLKIMEETKGKKVQIEDLLTLLAERLGELEKEKSELSEYQDLERTRRHLEHAIYSKELNEVERQIQQLEVTGAEETKGLSDLEQQNKAAIAEIKEKEKELKQQQLDLTKLLEEKHILQEERTALQARRAKLDLEVVTATSLQDDEGRRQINLQNERKRIEKEVTKSNKALATLTDSFRRAVETEQAIDGRIADHERRIQELHTRQGRAAQFKSTKERDDWIEKELKALQSSISAKKQHIARIEEELTKLDGAIDQEKATLEKKTAFIDDHKATQEQFNARVTELTEKRDKAANRRKDLWREEADQKSHLQQLKESIAKAERQLNSTLSREQAQGLDAIRRLKVEHNITGVYAPLIELFTCTEEEMVAVEAAGKSHLFNVVVDTDETASKLMQLLENEKAGRVTFMPLNRLESREASLPRTESSVPLIDRLKFKGIFRKAFAQVFGRTLLCATLEEAASLSRQHNVDCITLEGDQVSRKGAFTGGYVDTQRSRLALMASIQRDRAQIDEIESSLQRFQKDVAAAENLINRFMNEIQELEKERAHSRYEFESFSREASLSQKRILSLQTQRQGIEPVLTTAQQTLHQMEESFKALRAEIGTKLVSKLSTQEEKQLQDLTRELEVMKSQRLADINERANLQAKKTIEESRLVQNLLPQLADLEKQLSTLILREDTRQLAQLQTELEGVISRLEETESRFGDIEEEISRLQKSSQALRKALDDLKEREHEANRQLQNESGAVEKHRSRRGLLAQQREEFQRKLRELGALTAAAQKQYDNKPHSTLAKLLADTKKSLREYGSVNKKALDQYVQFKEQQEQLMVRKSEIDDSEHAIRSLIAALDEKKEAAIDRTFKMVARYFSEVFAELTDTPTGSAQLVLQKKVRTDEEAEAEDGSAFSGIDVKVSFTKSAKPQRLHQLSGGQQSLVALALIFAIQRCDPAPFYVFDEIDAALDDTHRMRVAEMIAKQAEGAQFLITTHRPELVQQADKHYLIRFVNKVSTIDVCEKEDALEVLQHDERDQELQDAPSESGGGAPDQEEESEF